MGELNQCSIKTLEKESSTAEKKNNSFPAHNIFAPSSYIVDHTEDELKRKRKKTFRR